MTEEHFSAVVAAAEAKKNNQGWWATTEGRYITLYASSGGSSLTVSRVEALRVDGELIRARSVRGEEYILAREDVFAGAVEPLAQGARRAGFG